MKKIIVSILVIVLLLTGTTSVMAKGKPPTTPGQGNGKGLNPNTAETETPGKSNGKAGLKFAQKAAQKAGKLPGSSNFVLFGTLKKVNATADPKTIDVEVASGNNLVQVFLGKTTGADETGGEEATEPALAPKELKGIVVPAGARIKVFENGQVKWTDLAGLEAALKADPKMVVRVHGWWTPAEGATFTGKPSAEDLGKGTWTAWQIFQMNPDQTGGSED